VQNFHDIVPVVGTFAMTMVTMMTTQVVLLRTLSKVTVDKKNIVDGEIEL